jgi:nitrogen fixation/metabolism regulation signal transduction histidine kinase
MFKSFVFNILFRISLISICIFLLAFLYFKKIEWITLVNLSVLIIVQIWLLFKKLNKVNKDLTLFFDSVEHNDFSLTFSKDVKMSSFYDKLYNKINILNSEIRDNNLKIEAQYQYFKDIVDNINVGILVLSEDGTVEHVNKSCKLIFGLDADNLSTDLKKLLPELNDTIIELLPEGNILKKIDILLGEIQLLIKVSRIRIQTDVKQIVIFQNIKEELDEKELESWHNLIHILTHEIINSTAPMSSSVNVVKSLFLDDKTNKHRKQGELNENTIHQTIKGLSILERRIEGLVNFVDNYRSLISISKPKIKEVPAKEIIESFLFLIKRESEMEQIKIETRINPLDISFFVDSELFEQVLINLFKNSLIALKENTHKKIAIEACYNDKLEPTIIFSDNGIGIPKSELNKIFIPFYSTKEDGTGIGLSLSKQIILMHKGNLTVQSAPNEKTSFQIILPGRFN